MVARRAFSRNLRIDQWLLSPPKAPLTGAADGRGAPKRTVGRTIGFKQAPRNQSPNWASNLHTAALAEDLISALYIRVHRDKVIADRPKLIPNHLDIVIVFLNC